MPLLELDQIEKHFGGLAAVNGVSVKADDGEILAIVGPNGAGKSTLLKLVVGLEAPTRGTVRFGGQDITGLASHRVRKLGIAMVQQTPRTFPTMTVLENAAVGAMFGSPSGGHVENEARARESQIFLESALGESPRVGRLNPSMWRLIEVGRTESALKVVEAAERLNVDDAPGEIYLKLENLQPIGSFKIRGATNAMALAEADELACGVYTASAGNMAQGVAYVARQRGIDCSVEPERDHDDRSAADRIPPIRGRSSA